MSAYPTDKPNSLAIPAMDNERRRSMELEEHPLPEGWIRQFDPASQHHFYVDTRASPPRSTWEHPYNDSQYLKEHGHDLSGSDSESDNDHKNGTPDRFGSDNNRGGNSASEGSSSPKDRGMVGDAAGVAALGTAAYLMYDRYKDRREHLNQAQQYPQGQMQMQPQMAGPMYPQATQMFAPPMYPMSRCETRRARRAMRRGYGVPMISNGMMVPPAAYQTPLFGYLGRR